MLRKAPNKKNAQQEHNENMRVTVPTSVVGFRRARGVGRGVFQGVGPRKRRRKLPQESLV